MTSICFVACHFAAHVDNTDNRNKNFHDICKRLIFTQYDPPMKITEHDMVYWMGDLNYRIDNIEVDLVKKALEMDNLEELLQNDQLRLMKNQGMVFPGFIEGKINFKPTYKFDPGELPINSPTCVQH